MATTLCCSPTVGSSPSAAPRQPRSSHSIPRSTAGHRGREGRATCWARSAARCCRMGGCWWPVVTVPSGPKAQTTPPSGRISTTRRRTPGAARATCQAFAPTPPLTLRDGRVLILGLRPQGPELAVDLYDPACWALDAGGGAARSSAPPTRRPCCPMAKCWSSAVVQLQRRHEQVLAAAERYDPVADRWTPTATLSRGRAFHTAASDGRVLIVGGITEIDDPREPDRRTRAVNTAEFYADGTRCRAPVSPNRTVRARPLLRLLGTATAGWRATASR